MRLPIRVRAAALTPALLLACLVLAAAAQVPAPPALSTPPPVEYVLSFPEPHHRWMQAEMTVRELGDRPLEARMSRSSPGRYALHEFAKNVWDVEAVDGAGRRLPLTRPDPHQWTATGHDGTVTLRYKVYGDRVDGTYLAVDATHAHMNVPATLMFARGLEDRPARVTLTQPPGRRWTAATQLFSTAAPLVFTAPNQAYLADSPIEFGDIVIHTFSVPARGRTPAQTIRVALHHQGTTAEEARAYVEGVERIVAEMQGVFGELPAFEPGHYTFIADYLPWASGDGMEHRNSTVVTSSAGLATGSPWLLSTVAHEFAHAWNVERIRPASLEPFDLDETNTSGELWFAEGVTSHVDVVVMLRAGLLPLEATLARWGAVINAVNGSPATRLRSAVEMSRLAAFTDGASSMDRTNHANTILSYYGHGAAIGLALDLTLRGRSEGRVSLDDYFRLLWERFGRPEAAPGIVARPYTLRDLRDALAEVSGSVELADTFFDRHVEGRAPFDWAALFAPAGIGVLPLHAGEATLGDVSFDFSRHTAKVSALTPFGSPAHAAGLTQDDVLEEIDGVAMTSAESVRKALDARAPGDEVRLRYLRRHGERVTARVRLAEAAGVRLVKVEEQGGTITDAQRAFRDAWFRSRTRP